MLAKPHATIGWMEAHLAAQPGEYARIDSLGVELPTWLAVIIMVAVGFCLRRLVRIGLSALASRRRR
jgi:hypothetical protein